MRQTAATLEEDLFESLARCLQIEAKAMFCWGASRLVLLLFRPSAFAESGCHRLGLHAVRTSSCRYKHTHTRTHAHLIGSHIDGSVPVLFINSLAVNCFLFWCATLAKDHYDQLIVIISTRRNWKNVKSNNKTIAIVIWAVSQRKFRCVAFLFFFFPFPYSIWLISRIWWASYNGKLVGRGRGEGTFLMLTGTIDLHNSRVAVW